MDTVLKEKKGKIGYLTLNRPNKLNTLSDELLYDFIDGMDNFEEDEEIRVIVIKAAGRAFCAGFDISPREKPFATIQDWREHAQLGNRAMFKIWDSKKPVIAQVHGYCLGGGCDLAMVCDIVVAGENAIFGEPEIQFSSMSPFVIMPWTVGMKHCKNLMLTGDRITATEAEKCGLITRVVPDEKLESETFALAKKLIKIPVPAMRMNKQSINRAYEIAGLRNALLYNEEVFAALHIWDTPEKVMFFEVAAKEGLSAAFKWRDARFSE